MNPVRHRTVSAGESPGGTLNQGTAGLAAAVPESGRKRSWRDFSGLTAEECLTCLSMSCQKVRAGLRSQTESDAQLTRAVPRPGSSGGILSREKAGKTQKSSLSHRKSPGGISPREKGRKTRKFPLFHEKSPGGTSPGAYRGVQRRIYAVYRGYVAICRGRIVAGNAQRFRL